jgi:lysozyme family protein
MAAPTRSPKAMTSSLAGDPGEAPTKLIIPSARGEAVDTFARGAIHIANPVSAHALFTQHVLAVAAVEADAHVSQVWNSPNDWDSSAMDALTVEGFTGKTDWSLARVLCRWETYNGFGSRARGINTPYLWSFSTHYERGKFLSDRHWDPNLVSKQCGAAVMLRALVDAGQVDPLPDA